MNTKELLAHLYEIYEQLMTAAERVDETRDSFNNKWLSSKLTEIETDINRVKNKIIELEKVYTF